MRKAALLGGVAALALGTSVAKADVYVDGDIYKDVDIKILEKVDKFKAVYLDVLVLADAKTAAEAETVFNQDNSYNHACENCAEKVDLITGSVNHNTGITSVNQSGGNLNNQTTSISFAFVDASHRYHGRGRHHYGSALADSQVAGEQKMHHNTIYTVNIVKRDALITKSVNNNSGITAVNQSVGNINNQANAISIAASRKVGVALSDVALGQVNAGNKTTEYKVAKSAQITGSVNANQGITAVNQTAGNMANQSNVVSLSATGF
jgi:hypothetical protein